MDRQRFATFRGDQSGAVTTEYLVVFSFVGILFIMAIVALGPHLVEDYQSTRDTIAAPYP